MKKRNLFLLSALLYIVFALLAKQSKAQNVGINSTGATPNNSAMLDVDVSALGTKKGLLIPRVTAAQKTAMNPLPAAAQGLVVYQTDGVQGFYYNTSTSTTAAWSYIAPSGVTGWSTLGNAGTNPTTNFIGTSDAQDLVVRTSSIERYRVTSAGFIGIGTTLPEEMIHIDNGNMLLDYDVIVKGRSGYGGMGVANLLRVTSDDVEIGSNNGPETFREMRLYIPHANSFMPNDGRFEIRVAGSALPLVTMTDQEQIGFNQSIPEEMLHISNGNMLLDNDVIIKGRSGFGGSGKANLLRITSDDVEIGSNNGPETFREMRLYVPHGNSFMPNDGRFEIRMVGNPQALVTITDQELIGFNQSIPEEMLHISNGNMLLDTDVIIKGRSGYGGSGKANLLKVTSDDVEIGSNSGPETFREMRVYIPHGNSFMPNDGRIEFRVSGSPMALVTMTDQEKVGINNSSPTADLDLYGTFKMVDGTEALNKVLTSDASGNATWQDPVPAINTAWGLLGNAGTTPVSNFIGTTDAVDLVFRTNNSEKMRIESGGNVGIGTNNPAFKLHLVTDGVSSSFKGDSYGGGFCTVFEGRRTSGNLASPTATVSNTQLVALAGRGYNGTGFTPNANAEIIMTAENTFTAASNPTSMTFTTTALGSSSPTARMKILPSGFVGIGTTAPATLMHVHSSGTTAARVLQLTNASTGSGFANGFVIRSGITTGIDIELANQESGHMSFCTNNTQRMMILSSGEVGIGTSSPAEKLAVIGAETTLHGKNACISVSNASAVGTGWFLRAGAAGTATPTGGFSIADNAGYRFSIDNAGRVGINTTTPSAILDVNGTTKIGTLGTALTNIIKTTVNVDVAPIAAGSTILVAWTVTNAATGSTVSVSPATSLANGLIIAYARVSAANTVELKFTNVTGASIDPALMDYYVTIIR